MLVAMCQCLAGKAGMKVHIKQFRSPTVFVVREYCGQCTTHTYVCMALCLCEFCNKF